MRKILLLAVLVFVAVPPSVFAERHSDGVGSSQATSCASPDITSTAPILVTRRGPSYLPVHSPG
jgi:hypothetical protein